MEKLDQKPETYPGYPSRRLFLSECEIDDDGILHIPEGPWEASQDPLPTLPETEELVSSGFKIDSLGRPLHPNYIEMLADPNIGVVTGKGFYYNWGPNFTADPIVIAGTSDGRKILLIRRRDTGKWALPGGFVDLNESALHAAIREVSEEAGLTNIGYPIARIFKGPVSDIRTTVHSWAETTAYLWQLESAVDLEAGDDAIDARWFDIAGLPDNLHGSHDKLIRMALMYKAPETLKEIIDNTLSELVTISEAHGGHMAYQHLYIDSPEARLFLKVYDPEQFTDPIRQAHSLAYLKKEIMYLDHLKQHGWTAIPGRFEFIDEKILALDAMRTEEGWHWRLPTDKSIKKKYVSEILAALGDLAKIPLPTKNFYDIAPPTIEILENEGWKNINEQNITKIKNRVRQLSAHFTPDLRQIAEELISNLDILKNNALSRKSDKTSLSHNDARQSNIAWHPDKGVRIVDWSWADPGLPKSDTTMFLIDISKSGFDVSDYIDQYFNPDHALLQIGFWLAHSIEESHDGTDTVRMQQVASAATAYRLLNFGK